MAEFVQRRLEEGLPELSELQRTGVFSGKEIKNIIKKRKVYEYRLERRTKCKDDYLNYIKYEIGLLKFLSVRRKKLGIGVDYKIDFAITNRINLLFRKAIFRYQSDVKLWLSNIEFCCQVRWFESVSRLYAGMLRVHSDKPEVWIAAAKFELESMNSAETARKLFLRGLRFHPDSQRLYLEFFRMELVNVSAKRDILKGTVKKSQTTGDPIADYNAECKNDPVLSGTIAMTVYRNATKKISDGHLASLFLGICKEFEFAHDLQLSIYEDLELRFADNEHARAALARKPFDELSSSDLFKATATKGYEVQCLKSFEKSVVDVPTEKMWTLYIRFCLELLNQKDTDDAQERRRVHITHVFKRVAEVQLLQSEFYAKWAYLADTNDRRKIWKMATVRYPQNMNFWRERIAHYLSLDGSSPKKISKMFDEALKEIPTSDSFVIRQMCLHWHMLLFPGEVDKLCEEWLTVDAAVASKIKTMYLEWVFTMEGMKATRKLYRRLWSEPPISIDFFNTAADMELTTLKPSMKRIREIMDAACRMYGTSNVDLWLRYTELENRFAKDIGRVGQVHWRAMKTLNENLVDRFVAHRTLSQNCVAM